MMISLDEKQNENEKYIKLSNILSNLPIKVRDKLWKEFFEKARPHMNILEFLEMKIKKREIKPPKTLNTI